MAHPTLFLIDGSSQMYRAYHAFRGRGLSNQEGRSTHAVYVFVTMLRKLFADHDPAYIAASFDLAGPTFRDEIAADYKANRAQMPDDLVEQINWVHEACEAMGVPILTWPGYEADDVIGTIATRAVGGGPRGGDRLDRQGLLSARSTTARSASTTRVRMGPGSTSSGVLEKFGVKPSQVVDVLALVGDTSDNVAGVPGIGKKGAIDLITQFGSLDGLLAHTADLKPKQRDALEATSRAGAPEPRNWSRSRPTHRSISIWSRCAIAARRASAAIELFTRLAFRTLVNDYAPTADSVRDRLRARHHRDRTDVTRCGAAVGGTFRHLPDHRSAVRDARGHRGHRGFHATTGKGATSRSAIEARRRETTCWRAQSPPPQLDADARPADAQAAARRRGDCESGDTI